MDIKKEDAVAVLSFCGWKNIDTWGDDKILKKLGDVKDVVKDEPPEDEDLAATLKSVVDAIDNGEEIVLVEEKKASDPKTEKEKTPKEKKAPRKKREPGETWVSAAIKTLKETDDGLNAETTDDMVKSVNKLRGKTNDSLARNHIRLVQNIVKSWNAS